MASGRRNLRSTNNSNKTAEADADDGGESPTGVGGVGVEDRPEPRELNVELKLREEVAQLKERIGQLEEACKKKDAAISSFRVAETLEARKKMTQGKGRNARRVLRQREDGVNQAVMGAFIKNCLYPGYKFWEPVMDAYYEEDSGEGADTVCGLVMSKVSVPDGTGRREYWERVKDACKYKIQQLRNQFLQLMKAEHAGKYYISKDIDMVGMKIIHTNSRTTFVLVLMKTHRYPRPWGPRHVGWGRR